MTNQTRVNDLTYRRPVCA